MLARPQCADHVHLPDQSCLTRKLINVCPSLIGQVINYGSYLLIYQAEIRCCRRGCQQQLIKFVLRGAPETDQSKSFDI